MTTAIHPMGFVNITPKEISMAHEAYIANRSRLWGARVSSYARPVAVHLPAMALAVYASSFVAIPYFTYAASIAAYQASNYSADTKFGKGITQCTEATLDKTVTASTALIKTGSAWRRSSHYKPGFLNVMKLSLF